MLELCKQFKQQLGKSSTMCSQKGGMKVVRNEKHKLIPTRTMTEWRFFMDYQKLNDATRKDHDIIPFIDQMLD